MDYNELKDVLAKLNRTVQMAQQRDRLSLDETLISINQTLQTIGGLLETVQVAVLIVAIALSFLLIGMTATCYYAKYKKYSRVSTDEERRAYRAAPPTDEDRFSYRKGEYHPTDI
ncbi:unnamed protein product, partial [Mesorhabditis spiculigera]